MMPPNLPETMGTEEVEHETNAVAVQNLEYHEMRESLLTPQTSRKMNHISKKIKHHPKKASLTWKHCVLNIYNYLNRYTDMSLTFYDSNRNTKNESSNSRILVMIQQLRNAARPKSQ